MRQFSVRVFGGQFSVRQFEVITGTLVSSSAGRFRGRLTSKICQLVGWPASFGRYEQDLSALYGYDAQRHIRTRLRDLGKGRSRERPSRLPSTR